MTDISEKVAEILRRQDELDERLQAIEADREEFKEMKRTNESLHREIQELKDDIELQYKTSVQIQKESFDKMNQVYQVVLGFKGEQKKARGEWVIALIGALGGGATIAVILQWLF